MGAEGSMHGRKMHAEYDEPSWLNEMLGNCQVTLQLMAPRVELSSTKLVV
jgi:hypothetical protein